MRTEEEVLTALMAIDLIRDKLDEQRKSTATHLIHCLAWVLTDSGSKDAGPFGEFYDAIVREIEEISHNE